MKNPTETYMKNPLKNPLDLPLICSRQVVANLPPLWVWDMSEEESLGRSRGREELRERGTVGTWGGNKNINERDIY